MPPVISGSNRTRALASLKQAEAFLQGAQDEISEDNKALVDALMVEGQKIKQAGLSLVLALLRDDYAPAELFKPWASVRRIREWRDDPTVKLDVVLIHDRTCVKPSAFFAHWNSLPAEKKRKTTLSAGKSSGPGTQSLGGPRSSGARSAKAGRG